MLKERTLRELRRTLNGTIYIWVGNDPRDIRAFVEDAERQGYMFGSVKPTASGGANIVSLHGNSRLGYVGIVGHMRFNTEDTPTFHRVDYKKFISGAQDYSYRPPKPKKVKSTTMHGNFFEVVEIRGDECDLAEGYISEHIADCAHIADEDALYTKAEQIFEVCITRYEFASEAVR